MVIHHHTQALLGTPQGSTSHMTTMMPSDAGLCGTACPAGAEFCEPAPGSPCESHRSEESAKSDAAASHASTMAAEHAEHAEQQGRRQSMEYVREWIATASVKGSSMDASQAAQPHVEDAPAPGPPQPPPAPSTALQGVVFDDASSTTSEACCLDDVPDCDIRAGPHLSEEDMNAHVADAMRGLARLERVGINPQEMPTIRALFVRWTIANWEKNQFGGVQQQPQQQQQALEEPSCAPLHSRSGSAEECAPMALEAAHPAPTPHNDWDIATTSDASTTDGHAVAEAEAPAIAARRTALTRRPRSRGIDKRKGCVHVPLGHIRGSGSCIVKAAQHSEREIISLSRTFIPSEEDIIQAELDDEAMGFMLA